MKGLLEDVNLCVHLKMTCFYLQVPHPWGLSPVKNQDSPSFLDIDLPEDEEDEDFDPDKVAISTG